jgi:hypothetical protein
MEKQKQMKKTNIDSSKPKRKYKHYTRKGDSQAELREAIKKAHQRIVGVDPSYDRGGKLQFGSFKKNDN